MYPIETTLGFIVSVVPRRDADLSFQIFTREFGMVYAYAQSASKESSKLRGALPLYGLAEVSFVHGKAGYRMTASRLVYSNNDVDGEALRLIAALARLLKTLCPESEPNEELFAIIERAYETFSSKTFSEEQYADLEIQQTAMVLESLGYWPSQEQELLEMDMENFALSQEKRRRFIQVINTVLQSSHL